MIKTLETEDEKLSFEFNLNRWSLVEAFDKLPDVEKYANSKVDFIGLLDTDKLFLIEVKNLRERPLHAATHIIKKLQIDYQSNYDSKNQPIVKEVIDSVKDSLLFITLQNRYALENTSLWAELARLATSPEVKIYAVFCLETDFEYLPNINPQKLSIIKEHILRRLQSAFERIKVTVLLIDSSKDFSSNLALKLNYNIDSSI